jgi:hypothetical protein
VTAVGPPDFPSVAVGFRRSADAAKFGAARGGRPRGGGAPTEPSKFAAARPQHRIARRHPMRSSRGARRAALAGALTGNGAVGAGGRPPDAERQSVRRFDHLAEPAAAARSLRPAGDADTLALPFLMEFRELRRTGRRVREVPWRRLRGEWCTGSDRPSRSRATLGRLGPIRSDPGGNSDRRLDYTSARRRHLVASTDHIPSGIPWRSTDARESARAARALHR